jgi:hypothetical protein
MSHNQTLKQINSKARAEKHKHSHAYCHASFREGTLTKPQYNSLYAVEQVEYRKLHVPHTIPPHKCGHCEANHIFGGYCSEEEIMVDGIN